MKISTRLSKFSLQLFGSIDFILRPVPTFIDWVLNMADHHGHNGTQLHDAAHHAADHGEHHHSHGSWTRAKQSWMNPLTDPYRGYRYEKFARRRMWFFGLAWGYGVVFGGWMSYRLLNEWSAWTFPVRFAHPNFLELYNIVKLVFVLFSDLKLSLEAFTKSTLLTKLVLPFPTQ